MKKSSKILTTTLFVAIPAFGVASIAASCGTIPYTLVQKEQIAHYEEGEANALAEIQGLRDALKDASDPAEVDALNQSLTLAMGTLADTRAKLADIEAEALSAPVDTASGLLGLFSGNPALAAVAGALAKSLTPLLGPRGRERAREAAKSTVKGFNPFNTEKTPADALVDILKYDGGIHSRNV